jgi:hypothetical protein
MRLNVMSGQSSFLSVVDKGMEFGHFSVNEKPQGMARDMALHH